MARTDGLKKTPGITKENAREMQLLSAAKKKQNNAERMVMRDIALKRVSEEDRAAMCDALIEKARNGDEKSMTLLLQLLGEMPDAKQQLDVTVSSLSPEEKALLENVRSRYES